MSLKTKLTSLITTFVLLCSLLTVGVFAVKNTTFNVGGDIVFDVKGIEADIELTANGLQNAVLAENAVAGTDVMNKIEIRNNTSAESVASQFAKWSNLDMTFAEGQSTATIELKITNKATEEDNYIDITALADATTKENARIKVQNNAGGVTALLKSGEDATFTITFSVIDDEYKASLNDFSVNFDMQKKVLDDFPSYDADSRITIECDTTAKTASVTGNSITEANTEIDVPKYVQKDNVVCAVTSIGSGAFDTCENLTSITITNSVTTIEDFAFSHCTNLTSITIPSSVTSIGFGAFNYCSGLTSITIPGSVTSIASYAFEGCTNLTSITIPSSATSIDLGVFSNCSSLTSILVESGNTIYDSRNNCNAIIETATNTLIQGCQNTVIPNTVTSIGSAAFSCCSGLTNITIPDSVEAIGESAFSECENLTTINYTGTQEQWNAIEGLEFANIPDGCTINFLG